MQDTSLSVGRYFFAALATLALLIAGCGGGGSGSTPSSTAVPSPPPPPPPINSAPNVDAGQDQNVDSGTVVTLQGSGSDPDGDLLTYSWIQTVGPDVMLLDPQTTTPRLIAPYNGDDSFVFELTATDPAGLSDSSTVAVNVTYSTDLCTVEPPPVSFGFDPFHTKYCDANGIPVTAGENVADDAVQNITLETKMMTSMRLDVLEESVRNGLRIVIRAENEVLTDIPEYSDLYTRFPGIDFDTLPGIGAVFGQPLSSTSEENAVCRGLNRDNYNGFSVHIHELMHSIENMGIELIDQTWNTRKRNIYNAALAAGLWDGTFLATNDEEYIADGAAAYYNAAFDSSDPLHNDIDTREELFDYDPDLAELLAEVLPQIDIWSCR